MSAKNRIKIPETELKILFARSGNLCSFPACTTQIIAVEGDESKPLAEMAHIIAYEDNGPRSDPNLSVIERNKAKNLILFCPTHHTLIDKFEFQYNTQVLREMKRLHEQRVESLRTVKEVGKHELPLIEETLHTSILPISRIPKLVFSALTSYRKDNILELFDFLNVRGNRDTLYAFELRGGRIYTFSDLRESSNIFRGAYTQTSVEVLRATDLWMEPSTHRLYMALLNRSLTNFLKKHRVAYDAMHYRYYFQPERHVIARKYSYKSLAGKLTSKSVVHNPITKASGQPKSYWIHLASNISFQQVAERQWTVTIRPERHLTKDGFEPYTHHSIGSKITRIKSTMYNWNYLQEIQLWREFLCQAQPRQVLSFGNQAIVIENVLLKENIEWPGIPNDDKDFASQEHPEDLFSLAEINSLEEDINDLDDDLFSDEYDDYD